MGWWIPCAALLVVDLLLEVLQEKAPTFDHLGRSARRSLDAVRRSSVRNSLDRTFTPTIMPNHVPDFMCYAFSQIPFCVPATSYRSTDNYALDFHKYSANNDPSDVHGLSFVQMKLERKIMDQRYKLFRAAGSQNLYSEVRAFYCDCGSKNRACFIYHRPLTFSHAHLLHRATFIEPTHRTY
jgi:hypothetical protein